MVVAALLLWLLKLLFWLLFSLLLALWKFCCF